MRENAGVHNVYLISTYPLTVHIASSIHLSVLVIKDSGHERC